MYSNLQLIEQFNVNDVCPLATSTSTFIPAWIRAAFLWMWVASRSAHAPIIHTNVAKLEIPALLYIPNGCEVQTPIKTKMIISNFWQASSHT